MDLGWKLLIPLSLGWLLVLAGIRVARNGELDLLDSAGGDTVLVIAVSFVVLLVGMGFLRAALNNARRERLLAAGLDPREVG